MRQLGDVWFSGRFLKFAEYPSNATSNFARVAWFWIAYRYWGVLRSAWFG
ncbi:hypothetical protein LYNGBM3L_20240 [Moorena producens 3L]|uniref:Uncharacterized protein n=1 Tax=Moorena producens 3L TaxID=489825 RepID=F4XNN4_9CYAN|nr:hypothetical protein LYNGBM3L_20240 [Moorena producens 3L]